MTKEIREGSGCKFEKNSVNFSCKECELMAKERDYKAEYLRDKARGVAEKNILLVLRCLKKKVLLLTQRLHWSQWEMMGKRSLAMV